MAEVVHIPKSNNEYSNYPCWVPCVSSINNKEWYEAKLRGIEIEQKYEPCKPYIICKCGKSTGIGLHYIHKDGKVTASYFHTKAGEYGDPDGCEWHVFLILDNWTGEEYPPRKK